MGTRVSSSARLHGSVLEQAAGLRRPVPVSFEFFPPGDAPMEQTLWASVQRLAPLGPRFVSVTYGADGSTRERTHNIVMRILRETTLTPAPHLTCIGSSRDEILAIARGYWNAGIRHIVALRGAQIEPSHWDAMWRFYQETGSRKWGRPYLTRAFFDRIGEVAGDSSLLFLALRDGRPIAGALNFVGRDILYGRYWGAVEEAPFLHFELSYYRAIEWAIENGFACVQAGAQGEHKLARGYEPVLTRSVHFIPDPAFRDAIARFLTGERQAIKLELEWARDALPYREVPSA